MKEFYNNNKKILNIVFVVVGIIFIIYLIWTFYFSKVVMFGKEEDTLGQAGKKYFEMYASKMPSRDNEVSTISAKELYDKKFVQAKDLYIPKTKKGCDLTSSWVKARRENGKVEYYTYLKCGSFESKTDHEGPEIVLNGENEVTLDINEKYEEKGIKNVVDKKDGSIDINKVSIKNNDIDTSKVGTYEISYTAYDSLKNKTTVKRIVKVVRKLEGIIKEDTNNKNYYTGEDVNNYVQFSGMLWRMVGLNSDGTIKLVTADSISNVVYGNQSSYKKTNIYKWLNDYFYDHLASKKYVVKSNWCVGEVSSEREDGCDTKEKANVGLLTLQEYNKAEENESNYLASVMMGSYWLANKKDDNNSWVIRDTAAETFKTTDITTTRPVINIQKDMYAENGDGSYENPYSLGDYKKGKANSKLNDRVVGELVSYSGYNWIIMDTSDDGTTLIMTNTITDTNGEPLEIAYENTKNYKYSINEKGNIGYQINKSIKDYLVTDEKIIVNKWDVIEFDQNKMYDQFNKETYESKYSIPKSYDIFSASSSTKSWLIDYSKIKGNILFTGPGGRAFDMNIEEGFSTNAVKLVIKVNKNVTISSGGGTNVSPYVVK